MQCPPLRCALLQNQITGTKRLVGYWYESLNAAQTACYTTRGESYAVIWAVKLSCPYREGKLFTVCANHDSLKWILNLVDGIGMFARWRLRKLEVELDIVHSAGIKNQAANVLSRLDAPGMDDIDMDKDLPVALTEDLSEDTSNKVVKEQHAEWFICHICDHAPPTHGNMMPEKHEMSKDQE